MVFLRMEGDFVSYTPRGKENLHENLQRGLRAETLELAIRKEVRWSGKEGHHPSDNGVRESPQLEDERRDCWRWWVPHGF